MSKARTKKNGTPSFWGAVFFTESMRPRSRGNKKTMRAEIPRITKRLIPTRIRGVAGSSAIDHVEGDCLRLAYALSPTFCAVGCDDCKATYENLERSHFLLHRNWPDETPRWGISPSGKLKNCGRSRDWNRCYSGSSELLYDWLR